MTNTVSNLYTDGSYLKHNPTWHVEDAPYKANWILQMFERNHISPESLCEVGCGAGEILRLLKDNMNKKVKFFGYEISPQAFQICKKKSEDRLLFKLRDILTDNEVFFDVILLIDVIEHIEDYLSFLRKIRVKSRHKILHIPLDMSVQAVLRGHPIVQLWQKVGHIHCFTKDSALMALREAGYEVLDYFYTSSIDLPKQTVKSRIMRFPRRCFYKIHNDLAVRLLGGYSLMVLAS